MSTHKKNCEHQDKEAMANKNRVQSKTKGGNGNLLIENKMKQRKPVNQR